ncbi:MAG: hypothetical protein EZS28_009508 [Streblomastix strix]|uniref:Uncharacterized protein n=1 Tax=Streblomastix strix TaxID=222440 RepID=A0A5J4WJE2_9EUKA|nr:MAG: hypothetical protein EZS28_009508 [Streblomastix strix]
MNLIIISITIIDTGNSGLFVLTCQLLSIDSCTIRRSGAVIEAIISGNKIVTPSANFIFDELSGTLVLCANEGFDLINNTFIVYVGGFQKSSTQETLLIQTSSLEIIFYEEFTTQSPTITAYFAMNLTDILRPVQIKKCTYTGNLVNTFLFSASVNDIIIEQGEYKSKIVHISLFLLSIRYLQIISGIFSRSSEKHTYAPSFIQNASVIIGSATSVPAWSAYFHKHRSNHSEQFITEFNSGAFVGIGTKPLFTVTYKTILNIG